jgi:hypothetical protein
MTAFCKSAGVERAAHRWAVTGVTACLLTACAAQHPPGHHGPDACAAWRQQTDKRSIEERRAAAERHIVQMHGAADAAHIERHLQMMERRCGTPAAPASRN